MVGIMNTGCKIEVQYWKKHHSDIKCTELKGWRWKSSYCYWIIK